MNFALVYLIHRFFFRLSDFVHHWYVDGSRNFAHAFTSLLEMIDRTIALKITLKYFFEPLYRDYSIIGRILGIVFRSGRVLVGTAMYGFLLLVFLAFYLMWALVPILIVFYVAANI